jgi:putative transposase
MGKRHSPEQIVRKLRQAEARLAAGATVPEAARELGISEATFHRWRNHYSAMSTSEAPQGIRERERSPQEAACREGVGHRHPKGGEPGNF